LIKKFKVTQNIFKNFKFEQITFDSQIGINSKKTLFFFELKQVESAKHKSERRDKRVLRDSFEVADNFFFFID